MIVYGDLWKNKWINQYIVVCLARVAELKQDENWSKGNPFPEFDAQSPA